jgi:hypothetical protein
MFWGLTDKVFWVLLQKRHRCHGYEGSFGAYYSAHSLDVWGGYERILSILDMYTTFLNIWIL